MGQDPYVWRMGHVPYHSYGTWLIWNMTQSYGTWLIRDMTQKFDVWVMSHVIHMGHDSYGTWFSHMRHDSYVTWLMHLVPYHSYGTWLIQNMTQWYVTWLTHNYLGHDWDIQRTHFWDGVLRTLLRTSNVESWRVARWVVACCTLWSYFAYEWVVSHLTLSQSST